MKKTKILWLALGLFLLTGCVGCLVGCQRVEPEMRAYPLAIGIGYEDQQYRIMYAMPDLSPYTGDGKEPEKRELVWDYTGTSFEEIDLDVRKTKEQKIDLGHVQVVLLDEKLLPNEEAYKNTMEYLLEQPMLGSGAYVFSTSMLGDLMAENGGLVDSLGEYLTDVLKRDGGKTVSLQDLYNVYYNRGPVPRLLTVETGDEQIRIEGLV